jgi:predicted amidohydrolase
VAVVQTLPALGDVDGNLEAAERELHALSGKADLVVFPELFTTGYSLNRLDLRDLAEPVPDGPSTARLADAARRGVAVVGTLIERHGDDVYDTAIVIDSDGRYAGAYRKTHLHPTEDSHFTPGDRLAVVELRSGLRIGLAICFELGFPELFAELALSGAHVIAVPSAVPDGFGYLLDLRMRARAQDNQVFVLAANLAGDDGFTRWCGGSAIVDPRGEPLALAPTDHDAQLAAELELDTIAAERRQEPLLVHRRPELYTRLRATTTPHVETTGPDRSADVRSGGPIR